MVAIHLTFQCRADTGDYGGKIGPTVLRTITVYLMACTKPRTNPVVPSALDNTNTKNLAKEMQNFNDSKGMYALYLLCQHQTFIRVNVLRLANV